MSLREIGVKNLKKIFDSSEIDDKTLFMSVCDQLFWFVFSKLESQHECTNSLFHKKLTEITNDLSNMSESDLFKIYFEENFYVIESWFDSNEEMFYFLIKLILLFIHLKSDSCLKREAKILTNIVKTALLTMEYLTNNRKLQLIACVILNDVFVCSDSVLQFVNFDRYKCIQLVMNSLLNFEDSYMNRIAVWITCALIRDISFVEKSNLFLNHSYIKSLLNIVENNSQQTSNPDIILNQTLSLFWCLTDESPKVCEIFVEQKGLNLFFLLLKVCFFELFIF
jgi:hypothetical protein